MTEHVLIMHFDHWFSLQANDKLAQEGFNCANKNYQVGDTLILKPIAYTNGHDDNSNEYVYLRGEIRKRISEVIRDHPSLKAGRVLIKVADV